MEDGRTKIEQAIAAACEAGKLREYVRKDGGAGLAGLTRLADRHTAVATAALGQMVARPAHAGARL